MKKRLTERIGDGIRYTNGEYNVTCYPQNNNLTPVDELAVKLCDIEDKIENGTLVDLPCSINHESLYAIVDLYKRSKIVDHAIAKYNIDCIIIGFAGKPIYRCCNASNEWMDFDGDEIGKTVFLTQEEAENEIKNLQKRD